MNQVVKDKMQREIMVVKNDILFSQNPRVQWLLDKKCSFEHIILENYEYMVRWQAEVNFDYKQPIPYGVVVSEDKKVFVYKRWWAGSNAGEARLHSKMSFWVWGHIEVDDRVTNNLLRETLLREVEEEIKINENDVVNISVLGYINDDMNEVWKVHFWVAYAIEVSTQNFALEDGELDNGEFLTLTEIDELLATGEYDLEPWSVILHDEIKKYLA